MTPAGTRVVVSDDGASIRLTLYGASRDPLGEAVLAPHQAIRVASQLTAAALLHLERDREARAGIIR